MNEEQLKEIAILAKELGFKPRTLSTGVTFEKFTRVDKGLPLNDTCYYLLLCEIQLWLGQTYDIHINIRKENYFQSSKYEYFHHDVSHKELTDVTKQEELHESIMTECEQDIPGNHLNDEKYSKLIFERKFAFKTYPEVLLSGILKGLKLIKNESN